jgi:hypothetical protein
VVLVAAATVDPDLRSQPSLPRLEADALTVPALKSRAKLTRSLPRPGKRRLHYFFKHHQPTAPYGSLQMRVRDGKRYGTGSVSDPGLDHEVS